MDLTVSVCRGATLYHHSIKNLCSHNKIDDFNHAQTTTTTAGSLPVHFESKCLSIVDMPVDFESI